MNEDFTMLVKRLNRKTIDGEADWLKVGDEKYKLTLSCGKVCITYHPRKEIGEYELVLSNSEGVDVYKIPEPDYFKKTTNLLADLYCNVRESRKRCSWLLCAIMRELDFKRIVG